MHSLTLIVALLSFASWIYLALARGGFWMVWRLAVPKLPQAVNPSPVAVVIPARNEAGLVGRAVASLLRQNFAVPLHIFVVDDNSDDDTSAVARQAAAAPNDGARLHVLRGQPLPAGWSGKLWAMQQGIEQGLLLRPKFILLTDADIGHAPDNVSTLVSLAEHQGYDLVSFMVELECRIPAEKLLIPSFIFFFFMLYPPLWIRDSRRKTAGAAGGCILIRPEALARAGGLAAIRGEIIDDCSLARAVKKTGGRVWLGATSLAVSLRSYGSFREIESMVARNAFNQLRHSAWLLVLSILGIALAYLVPIALLFSHSPVLVALGAASLLLMWTIYIPVVRYYRLNILWTFTLPASAVFFVVATLHSALNYWSGRGGQWKGRAQDQVRPASS